MPGRANALNKDLTYCSNYDASTLNFNINSTFMTSVINFTTPFFVRSYTASNDAILFSVGIGGGVVGGSVYGMYRFPRQNQLLVANTGQLYLESPMGTSTDSYNGILTGIGGNSTVSSGVASFTANQCLIGSTTTTPAFATPSLAVNSNKGMVSAGLTGGASGYTLSFAFNVQTSAQTTPCQFYFWTSGGDPATPSTITLPSTSAVGDFIYLGPFQANATSFGGAVRIAQQANQYIKVGASTTTVGTGGYIQNNTGGVLSVMLICIEANLGWALLGNPPSNLSIV